MSRTSRAVNNISWGLFQRLSMILLPFLTRTVLIKFLGVEYLGLSSLFTSILGLLSLAELGVSSAIVSTMYKPIVENDTETICALMAFYRRAYYIIGFVIAIVGTIILPFLPRFIEGTIPNNINLYILYVIYLFNTVISYFLFAYKNCLFIAHQRNDINSKIQSGCMIVQNIMQIGLIMLFRNYNLYAIVIPFFSIVINIITAILAQKEYPEYVCSGVLKNEIKADIKKRVTGLMLANTSATIRGSIDSLFISAFLGLKMVAMYSNYFYIVTAIAGIIQILQSAIVAGVGDSIATESVEKNHKDCIKFTFILQWIVGWCSICILCLEQPFMKVWVGTDLMFENGMVVLCALYLFINCICLIRSIYTQALGMWWTLRYLSVIDIFINTFLNYFFGKNFGAYGILGVTIIDIALVSLPWTTYYLFRDYFGKKYYFSYMWGYLKYFLIATVIGGMTYLICNHIELGADIITLAIRGIVCLLFPNFIYFFVFHKSDNFKYMRNLILKIRK